MSFKEINYRLAEIIKNKIYKFRYKKDLSLLQLGDFSNINLEKCSSIDLILSSFFNLNIITRNNELILKKFLKYNLIEKIDYHKGMYGYWDRSKYCKEIDYKNSDKVGDIRVTWEINRHQFMPYLALIYRNTKDEKYLKILKTRFYEWIEQNPYLKGVNWQSSMEISIRSYQWLITYAMLKDTDELEFKKDLLKAIINSMKYVKNNLSKYSSANNHLIIESYILSIIGYCVFPIYEQKWFEEGYNELKKNLKFQFFEDGVNKEQALHYQAFVTDSMLQYNFFLKSVNKDPIEEELIKKSVEFIYNIDSESYNMDFGDSDDACLINFGSNEYNYYEYVLKLASFYYKKNYTVSTKEYPEADLFNFSIFDIFEKEREIKKTNIYRDGGYLIIRNNEIKLLFDFGILGFGKLATHGHADSLSFILNIGTTSVFRDSGTYIYTINEKKRNYYRGTSVHNTLVYNSENQSEIQGPGIWGKKAISKLNSYSETNNKVIIEAEHNGYAPFIHKRRLEYNYSSDEIKIVDYFKNNSEINFILDKGSVVKTISKNSILIEYKDFNVILRSDGIIKLEDCYISDHFTKEILSKKINIKHKGTEKEKHITLINIIYNKE